MADERPLLDRGDFVWTHFPSSEHPTEPSGQRHIALCLRSASHANGSHVLLAVYTTTKKPADRPKARGEIDVPDERAHEYGQTSGFRINVKRIAALPLTVDYFPDLEKPDHGKRGSSEHLANACEKLLFAIIKETPELVDFAGPEDSKMTIAKSF